MIGTVIENRYRIVRQLGMGGMAEVYLAHDDEADREVAIKMIKREYCGDPQYVRRFEREAKAVMSLDCPNIVHAYSCGVLDGRSYIVLEYVDGVTLKEYLQQNGRLTQRSSVQIACRVLNALAAAHGGGYVHRDVKPQNVLISRDHSIKLTDFGIAKDAASLTVTFNGKNVVGSVHYISPEQVSGEAVTSASDLYSVGIMLYEMLLGHTPFDGETSVQIAYKQVNERLIPPCEEDKNISPALSDVIVKATAKDPAVRYASAEEMKNDLIRALREPEERFAYLDPKVVMRKEEKEPEEEAEGGGRKHYAKLWHFILPASLMVALVIGMFAYWYFAMFGSNGTDMLKVPDVLDRTLEEATELLSNRDFKIRVAGTIVDPEYADGNVCRQSPEGGTASEKGSTVDVWLSSGGSTLKMQSLIGLTLDEAAARIAGMDLELESIDYESNEAPEGTVVRQSIPEDTEIFPGEESVSLSISGYAGVTLLPMPDLTLVSTLDGVDRLLDVYGVVNRRFLFGDATKGSSISSDGIVFTQYPQAGEKFLPGETEVEITLYHDYSLMSRAEVVFETELESSGSVVEVALEGEYGEFVLYTAVYNDPGEHLIEFTAGYIQAGTYSLAVYVNGVETTRFSVEFVSR